MPRLEYSTAERALVEGAAALEEAAKRQRDKAEELRRERDRERPLHERLIYAATARCSCGRGLAYDPLGEVTAYPDDSHLRRPNAWECSGTLRYTALKGRGDGVAAEEFLRSIGQDHDAPLPFSFYEIKSEDQPSAHGATTRNMLTTKATGGEGE